MTTVSIVLPTFNGAKYIKDSINSVLKQTFTDWELIIVDDCSQDNTLEIIREYEKANSKIRVIHNEINMKLPGALNVGFESANGRYLTWTSDDNMYMPDALAVMVRKIESTNAPMVCADEYAIDDQGILKWNTALIYRDEMQCWKNTIGACFLYRRDVYDNIGNYDMDLYCVEDYDYWLRIKRRYGKIERIDQVLYKYRYHEKSLSSTQIEKIRLALIQLRKKHLDFIVEELKGKEELLYNFYYDSLEKRTIDSEIIEKIQSTFPALKKDTIGNHGKYIIFGAGNYGSEAAVELDEKAIFFADNSPQKIGAYKEGRKVLAFDDMKKMSDQYDIMIAICPENVYTLARQLIENGINHYCTWQSYQYKYLQIPKVI